MFGAPRPPLAVVRHVGRFHCDTEAQTGRIPNLVWVHNRIGVAFEAGSIYLCGWLDIPAKCHLLSRRLKVCLICAKAGKAGALRLCYLIRISRRGCDARHESGMARLHLRNNLHMRCICFPWGCRAGAYCTETLSTRNKATSGLDRFCVFKTGTAHACPVEWACTSTHQSPAHKYCHQISRDAACIC